jgi:MFS family permease
MNGRLLTTLLCMSFLWVGSQIPLFLFGSVLPLIYEDIGGTDRWVWFIIGYLIPNAALCPFVGALSDLFGRQKVAIVGQVALIIGPIITATANSMNIAIGMGLSKCLCACTDNI